MIDYAAIFANFTGAFPNIVADNVSSPGAGDGTEFVKALVDDLWGFNQALLDYTDDTPDGVAEATGTSQRLESIKKIHANTTTQAVTGTHTVEEWDKKGVVLCTAALTTLTLAAGAGADETNRVLIINQTGGTINIDVGATIETLTNGGNVEYIYDGTSEFVRANGQSDINILTKTADYTITDADFIGYGEVLIYADGTSAIVDTTLPTLADNIGKKVTIKVIDDTNLSKLVGEGAETIDGMDEIEMPKEGDHITVIGQAAEWKILNENISCQFFISAYAGYGSTDTKIIRFTTIGINYGNLFTENHSSGYASNAEGLEITILKAGKYSCICQMDKVGGPIGISLNSSQLTTDIDAITEVDKITQVHVPSNGRSGSSEARHFDVGDVIRAHSDAQAATGNVAMFSISYIGS